jgi:hypothetical protein
MLSLRHTCMHPTESTPYIISSSGGKDNSPEGAQVLLISSLPNVGLALTGAQQGGLTHGFVVIFANAKDRDYYVNDDPAHKAFVKKNGPRFEDVRVVDYEGGVY